ANDNRVAFIPATIPASAARVGGVPRLRSQSAPGFHAIVITRARMIGERIVAAARIPANIATAEATTTSIRPICEKPPRSGMWGEGSLSQGDCHACEVVSWRDRSPCRWQLRAVSPVLRHSAFQQE